MYAIASLLDSVSAYAVRGLWSRFETHCGLTGIKTTPLPHFSWLGAQEVQVGRVESVLSHIARQLRPFVARGAGLGIFTGPMPVLYVPLVKDAVIMEAHRRIWEGVLPFSIRI